MQGFWNKKDKARYDEGKFDEALQAYEKAIRLDPNLADAWNSKGKVLKNLSRDEDANEAFAKAKDLGYIC